MLNRLVASRAQRAVLCLLTVNLQERTPVLAAMLRGGASGTVRRRGKLKFTVKEDGTLVVRRS